MTIDCPKTLNNGTVSGMKRGNSTGADHVLGEPDPASGIRYTPMPMRCSVVLVR